MVFGYPGRCAIGVETLRLTRFSTDIPVAISLDFSCICLNEVAMSGESWDKRFDSAIAEVPEWAAAYDELLAIGANPLLVRMLLKSAWSAEADFAEEHRKRLAVALTAGETLVAEIDTLFAEIEKFHDAVREALREEPEGLALIEQSNPLPQLAIQLANCAAWIEAYVLPAFGKHVSGTRLPKKRRGKKGRTKQPILRTMDVHMVTLLAYLRLIDDDHSHHKAVAHLMKAAAKASGVPVHWELDSHWVGGAETRFETKHSGAYEVVKGLAAKYVRSKMKDPR
jgi:hypothetical protein